MESADLRTSGKRFQSGRAQAEREAAHLLTQGRREEHVAAAEFCWSKAMKGFQSH